MSWRQPSANLAKLKSVVSDNTRNLLLTDSLKGRRNEFSILREF